MSIRKNYRLFMLTVVYLLSSKSVYLGALIILLLFFAELIFSKKWNLNFQPILFILCCILSFSVIGFISRIGSNNILMHDALRDVINFSFPGLTILFGYFFYSSMNLKDIYLSVLLVGIVTAIIQIVSFLYNPTLILQSVRTIREVAGTGYDAPVVAVLILIFMYNPFKKQRIFFFVLGILFIGVMLSFSRSNYLILLLGLIFLYFLANQKSRKIKFILLLIGAATFMLFLLPAQIKTELLIKFENSFNEISTKSSNFSSWSLINDNWRGYENYRVKQEILGGNLKEQLIGFGIGARLPLNLTIELAGEIYSAIPTIHSGYFYLLYKDGIIGLVMLFISYASLIQIGLHLQNKANRDFLFVAVLILIIKGITIGGIFNVQAAVIFLAPIGGILSVCNVHNTLNTELKG